LVAERAARQAQFERNDVTEFDSRKAGAGRPAVLSIIVPTFNERENVRELVARMNACITNLDWEVVFVDDDSPDGTISVLRMISRTDTRIHFLHRIGRRRLSSAVVEGMLSTSAPVVAVMDRDLQHDETLLPLMFERLRTSDCDVIVASRYMTEGGVGGWDRSRRLSAGRQRKLAHLMMPEKLTDTMSGFFMLRREAVDVAVRRLSRQGYKILLDILLSARPPLKVEEIPYTFRARLHGESKLDTGVVWDYLMPLIDKSIGRIVPTRFIIFMIVGGLGLCVHMAILATTNRGFDYPFVIAQLAATVTAMTFNFFINNLVTYRDKRLVGFRSVVRGLFSFYTACAIGAIANIGIASVLFEHKYAWWLSGVAGVLVGAVWNYSTTSVFTWRK
jgi:dolichol-phosphate mannosyltransferase